MYISYGIEYDKEKFTDVKNNQLYSDLNLPPTKPLRGGFWGSSYKQCGMYCSEWHEFIFSKLFVEMFKDKINNKSTIFELSEDAQVLYIDGLENVKLIFPNGEKEEGGNIPTRKCKVISGFDPNIEKRLYIDFEMLSKNYDAIYVSGNFLREAEKFLHKCDELIIKTNGNIPMDTNLKLAEQITKYQLFEDWHVESLLVMNPDCIKIIDFIKIEN
nr:hypothetical protein [uncultured Lachnoclostridium sp.]